MCILQDMIYAVTTERVATGQKPDVIIHAAYAYGTRQLPIFPPCAGTTAGAAPRYSSGSAVGN